MTQISPNRVERPSVAELSALERQLAAGRRFVVQFGATPYPDDTLAELNRLAERYGEALQIRFYAHYGETFDCAVLAHLPNVVSLGLDSLDRVENIEWLASLGRLKCLSLGVYGLTDGSILNAENLASLTQLILGPTRTQVFDLKAVASLSALTELRVCGHTRNLDAVGDLQSVRSLWLNSIPKRASLAFVARMQELRSLHVILGGRESLGEVEAPELEELEVVRVRGLRDLGNIKRFPKLSRLQIEDQLQLEQIQLGSKNAVLRTLHVYNCKNLRVLHGIEVLPQLEEVRLFRTAVEPEALRRERLAPTVRAVAFGSGKLSVDRAIRLTSANLGYGPPGEVTSEIGLEWNRQ